MIRNYLKVAMRNFSRNKVFSFINIAGLSIGMAVTLLIGLWIWDELSYNKQFENYNRIAQVMQNAKFQWRTRQHSTSLPFPIGEQLKKEFGSDFKYVTMSSWNNDHIISSGEKKSNHPWILYGTGRITEMLSLHMLKRNPERSQ